MRVGHDEVVEGDERGESESVWVSVGVRVHVLYVFTVCRIAVG